MIRLKISKEGTQKILSFGNFSNYQKTPYYEQQEKDPKEWGLLTVPDTSEFDWNGFEKQRVGQQFSGKPFSGKDGALTPIIQWLL